ncbi:nucleoside triphosphate pyrophosphohydrolase family protein [bacterium 210820-DFI.6.38]|nr:nucleoside triphosphate pyrophosphohydrolase family protein [bacterium 210820-DFI.6.38]
MLGLTGEAGEVADLVKKGIFHEKGINIDHLKKELGDVLWYIAMICYSLGISLDDVMQTNVDKLIARYPDGFDTYVANHRKAEDI